MLKRLGTGKVTGLLMVAVTNTIIIVYLAVEQGTGGMAQGLVFDTAAATEVYHQGVLATETAVILGRLGAGAVGVATTMGRATTMGQEEAAGAGFT